MRTAIILAGGSGVRLDRQGLPKQLINVAGRPLFLCCVETYAGLSEIERIVLVFNPRFEGHFRRALDGSGFEDRVALVAGGTTRQASISNAMRCTAGDEGIVVLQNAASPLTSASLVRQCLRAAVDHEAVQAYHPAHHTVFTRLGDELDELLPREQLGYTCDPTVYRTSLLRRLMQKQRGDGLEGEMTLAAVRAMGVSVALVRSEPTNLKITVSTDQAAIETILRPAAREP